MPALIGLIANLLPTAVSLFTGKDSNATKAVGIAADIATKLTGETDVDAAVKAIDADPALALEFKKALMENEHVAERLRYADIADAREMYKQHHEMQDHLAKAIMKWNLWVVFLLAAIDIAVMLFTPQEYSIAVGSAGTLIGIIINALLKERQDVVGFCFGSSMGSKQKDVKGK